MLIYAILTSFLFPPVCLHARDASESEIKKDQIEKIEKELSKEREKFLKLGEEEKSLLGQLSSLELKIEEKKRTLNELQQKIKLNKKEIKERQRKTKELEIASNRIERRIGGRLDAFYRYARRGYLRLLTSSGDLDQLRKRFKYLKVIMDRDQRLMDEMAEIQKRQQREISLVEEKLAIVKKMEREESKRALSLKEDLDKKVMLLMKIHKEKEFYETVVRELELAAQNLKETLLKLERNQEERRQLPTGFTKSKGKLPLPLDGEIIKETGVFASAARNGHKGVFIEGPSDAQVRAISPGRVDFSGWLRGYGQIVIINHGSRYFSVSAHLAQREKEEGDMVSKGEVIGFLGQSTSSSQPRLYFEIRKGGSSLDPLKWLKVN
ncbi:MAG: peptidoglycan DD-metalloendopeptidase family protein [Desulfobacteraceae bacterium]